MDTPRKNNDCYFYYYSTCLKGDGCTFRHEPAALGSETVCSFWAQGKCLNQPCNFRHMELKKNRKTIPCYWETQPSGCQKSHCSFQHKNPRPRDSAARESDQSNNCDAVGAVDPESPAYHPRRSVPGDGGEGSEGEGSRRLTQDYNTTPVDPLVVNFEEESDSESVPATSPKKRVLAPRAKTQEELHLERIQAESAAYYSYELSPRESPRSDSNVRVLTLAEIRAKTAKQNTSGRRAEQSSSRRPNAEKVTVTRKRTHSPIRFDISQAEPSVETKLSVVTKPSDRKAAFQIHSVRITSGAVLPRGESVSSNTVSPVKLHQELASRPVRLKRPRLDTPSTNGSHASNSKNLDNVSSSELVAKYEDSISSTKISSTDSSDLECSRPDSTVTVIDTPRVSVGNGGMKERDDSVDEDMLLDSFTEYDVLPEPDDIDAFLDEDI